MALVTIQVVDGADRGRCFDGLSTPITIGREEGNSIQLNDERVSRYHLKIQEDQDKIVLTDLESTNGTKVNGEEIQLRILRFGDMISIGRSVMLFGSRDQIAARLASLRGELTPGGSSGGTVAPEDVVGNGSKAHSLDFEVNWNEDGDVRATLHTLTAPELPDRLSPGQAAQLSEVFEYLHVNIRNLLTSATVDDENGKISLDIRRWQSLLDIQSRLAEYLRNVAEPDAE